MKIFETNEGENECQKPFEGLDSVGAPIASQDSPFEGLDEFGRPTNLTDADVNQRSMANEMDWPIRQEMQQVFQESVNNETELVPSYCENETCNLHGYQFDSRCPIKQCWHQSKNVRYYDIEFVPHTDRTAYYRPTVGPCTCIKIWTGQIVLNITRKSGTPVHLVTYRKLHQYQWLWAKSGISRIAYHKAESNQHRDLYGAKEEDLMPWHIFNNAVNIFQNNILKPNEKEATICPDCGPEPDFLCCDGIMLTLPMKSLHSEKPEDLYLPMISNEILDAPQYSERMLIRDPRKRAYILQNVSKGNFPEIDNVQNDLNLQIVKDYFEGVRNHGNVNVPKELRGPVRDVCANTATIGLFQPFSEGLLTNIQESLQANEIMKDKETVKLKQLMQVQYPVMFLRLEKISQLNEGNIPAYVKYFYVKLIQFTIDFYRSCPMREEGDYIRRTGEIKGEWMPNFVLKRERAKYQADERSSVADQEALSGACLKDFVEGKTKSGGIQILTCCCPKKRVYGFKTNVTGESPKFILDFIMTRTREDYNPTIFFDAACIAKEVALNREPIRFSKIRMLSDPLHADNHTNCSHSYNSRSYSDTKKVIFHIIEFSMLHFFAG